MNVSPLMNVNTYVLILLVHTHVHVKMVLSWVLKGRNAQVCFNCSHDKLIVIEVRLASKLKFRFFKL